MERTAASMQKIYVTRTWICQTWTLAKLSEPAEQGICLQAGFLFPCCQGIHVYLRDFICGKEKKWPVNIKCNKRKCQTKSDRLFSYHFVLWKNSICPLKFDQNTEMFPNELANTYAKGVRAEIWRGY